ncbi:MAG: cbb3-type cytochrome oxidase assembly protein CcoS [Verrucomicrobia bacterium]|nr:cbb3-type cytochrome oxidase assembly protein CcoS [Verrucomicrobiota bacterium]
MSIILVLIPLSILFALAFLGAFIWAVRGGQFEDTTTPSMRLLLDDKTISDRSAEPEPKLNTKQP